MKAWWETATVHACIPDIVLTFTSQEDRRKYYDVMNEAPSFYAVGADSQGNQFWICQGIVYKAIITKLATNRFDKQV